MNDSPDFLESTNSNGGRWTVVGMFAFAVTMIALLFLYWHFYTAPFREVQYAIAESFPDSSPRVVGGKHKSHKDGNPTVLRVVVYVPPGDFDPEEAESQSEGRAAAIASLAFENHEVAKYEQMQIVLLQKVPESNQRRWETTKSIDEWKSLLD